jgi:hypothetical protein
MDNVIERPDLASLGANAVNNKMYPSVLTSVPEDFGVRDVPIYFYNVGPQEHNAPRYPNHPHMLIRACPQGQDYIMARGSITHPFREMREDQNGERFPFLTNGFKEAAKILNPYNPGLDQDYDDPNALAENGNLNQFGVFWSKNNPPLPEEVAAAKKRLANTYRKELEKMVAIEAKEGPDGARGRANDISRAAANYFGQSYSWHRMDLVPKDVNAAKADCGACGEKIQAKARICMHCGAPTDPAKLENWLELKFAEKRPVGRPVGS